MNATPEVAFTSRQSVPFGVMTEGQWQAHDRRDLGAARPPLMAKIAQMMNDNETRRKGNADAVRRAGPTQRLRDSRDARGVV